MADLLEGLGFLLKLLLHSGDYLGRPCPTKLFPRASR